MAPPEWPMARITLNLPCSVQSYFKQELFRTLLQRCLTQNNPDRLLSTDVVSALSVSMLRLGQLVADFFQGVEHTELVKDFPDWKVLHDIGFWQKSAIAEMAQAMRVVGESVRPTQSMQGRPNTRTPETVFSFILMHDSRAEMSGANLPMKDVKVYFPLCLLNTVMQNCARLGFRGSWNRRAPAPTDVKIISPQDKGRHSFIAMFDQGLAPVPQVDQNDSFEYPQVQELFCTGLLNMNPMEVLAGSKTATRLKVEFKLPSPEFAEQEGTWGGMLPQKWDIMTLSPGKLLTIGLKYFGPEVPLQEVLAQYEAFYWERFRRTQFVNELLDSLFVSHNKFTDQTSLRAKFAQPGWRDVDSADTARANKHWIDNSRVRVSNAAAEAQQRIGHFASNPFLATLSRRPWDPEPSHSQQKRQTRAAQYRHQSQGSRAASSSRPPQWRQRR